MGRRVGAGNESIARVVGYAAAGSVFGLGYVLGELPNSFAKRRLSIGPGGKARGFWGAVFFVADRCDSVVAALVLGAVLFSYGWGLVVAGTVFLGVVHLLVSAALYRARIKRAM
jgi:hypothetical protein